MVFRFVLGPFRALIWHPLGPLGPENGSGRPCPRSRFGGVPNGPIWTRFRAIFRFGCLPEMAPKGPRKSLTRPRQSHPEVAKGRPEVVERSQEGPRKVTERMNKAF